jgi:23S rRNA U2552 (ribose-2'-O)-methylase RlmE/FtsJ
MEIVGTRGFKGKKTKNANTMFNAHFDVIEQPKVDNTTDDSVELDTTALDNLEHEQT